MGLRGPTPKVKKSQILNFGAGLPPPPPYLDADGKKEYLKHAKQLEESGASLQQPDGVILAIFAQSVADIARLSKEIRKEGEVMEGRQAGMVKNPKCQVLESAKKMAINAGAKLGFSPVDRARVPAATKSAGRKNEFADL